MKQGFLRDREGEPDIGALIMLMIGVGALLAIINLSVLAAAQLFISSEHKVSLVELGAGIGAILGGLATLLGAYAGYQVTDGLNRRSVAIARQMEAPGAGPT